LADVVDAPRPAEQPIDDPAPGRSSRRVAPFVVAALAIVLGGMFWILLGADGEQAATAETPLLDRPAPAVIGQFEDGTEFHLSRRRGSWVVLNFFTHDCIPCIREHDELIRFVDQQRALGLEGAEFYSIVQNSTPEEVGEFFAERGGGDWPVVYDTDFEFQIGFGVAQVPETWVIDPDGIVRGRLISELDSADRLSADIQALREAGIGR
jgi:cytochrome c biogenesis protein CcmG/thiol:disulfide interchange protein DsbE